MSALQCLSLEPDGSAVATVRGRTLRFRSLDALAEWLHPDADPAAAIETAVTQRSLAAHVLSPHTLKELAA
jgi:hypothetical protein